ncbi:hypothetical protein PIB30_067953 [Stylosanthes scabra]|uniref:Uncharacterized protein n=1 Tax=Stylosanthes scabra TaxID=79078 RepID=A0ABU6YKX7_9FABA|nr:hypothetical protein [Stylosanthes scabra]
MTVNMHTLNVILLLGDTALNCLQVPWTGMPFFVLWTGAFVIFQWIIHACVPIWWPYPFLDLSLPLAPLWYAISPSPVSGSHAFASSASLRVFAGWIVAYSMLWIICADCGNETSFLVKMVPILLPVLKGKIRRYQSRVALEPLVVWYAPKLYPDGCLPWQQDVRHN